MADSQTMEILELIEFKNWADSVYLNQIHELTEQQFNEVVPIIEKSVKQILLHLYASYWGDYHLIKDRDWSDQPDFKQLDKSEIIRGIREYNTKLVEFITNHPLREEITFEEDGFDKPIKSNAENVLMNFVEHSSYHRGQLVLLLKYHGITSIEMTNFHPYIWKFKQ